MKSARINGFVFYRQTKRKGRAMNRIMSASGGKKIILSLFVFSFVLTGTASAQGMMGNWSSNDSGSYNMQFMMSPGNYQQM